MLNRSCVKFIMSILFNSKLINTVSKTIYLFDILFSNQLIEQLSEILFFDFNLI